MPSLAVCRCLFRSMRHCFLGRGIYLPVSESFRLVWKRRLFDYNNKKGEFQYESERRISVRISVRKWKENFSTKVKGEFQYESEPDRSLNFLLQCRSPGRYPWHPRISLKFSIVFILFSYIIRYLTLLLQFSFLLTLGVLVNNYLLIAQFLYRVDS